MQTRIQELVLVAAAVAIGVTVAAVFAQSTTGKATSTGGRYLPKYRASGDLILPKNLHEWVYVGFPLTPNALNGGQAMIAVAADGQMSMTAPSTGPKVDTTVEPSGNLHVPADYRITYQLLGSWAVASDQGRSSKELHVVYASPGTITAYRRNGSFPDGTVLVKEVFQAATGEMTTGTVSHTKTQKGWFVMVKDGNRRHAGNPLWGDGWRWSWFDAANPSRTTSTDYRTD